MFELFSEAVRSHYGVQCTCSAEKLVLAVRLSMLNVFIIIYVVTTVVTAKFIRILQVLQNDCTSRVIKGIPEAINCHPIKLLQLLISWSGDVLTQSQAS